MTYDGSDRKHIRQAEKAAKQAEARRRNFVKRLMIDMDGREWMHDLLTKCHCFHSPFVKGAPDATAFLCGEQNLGLQIFADVVSVCPNEYVLMMQEANAKETINERRYSDTDKPAEPTGTEQGTRRDDQGSIVAPDRPDEDAGPEDAGWVN